MTDWKAVAKAERKKYKLAKFDRLAEVRELREALKEKQEAR